MSQEDSKLLISFQNTDNFILLGRTEEVDRSLVSNPCISSSVSFRMDFS